MSNVETLLARCRKLGAEVTLTPNGTLKVTGPVPLPVPLRDELKQRKAELLALLTNFPSWPCPECDGMVRFDPVDVTILPTRFWICPACDAYGATREGATANVVWVGEKTVH
jgi:hypothetical protein